MFWTCRRSTPTIATHAIRPVGQRLYRNGKGCTIGDCHATKFRAPIGASADCALRAQYLRDRIDSEDGRAQYGRRLGTVEPVFGNLRDNKGLRRFTLRGQREVDGQLKLFVLVHNIEKGANCWKTG
jgi:hypothetical protein